MQDKKEQSRFENFLIQFKALVESYQITTPEPEEYPKPQITKQKKQKKQKDPLAPKMPKSAFIFYFQDKREKFQQQYPSLFFMLYQIYNFKKSPNQLQVNGKIYPKKFSRYSKPCYNAQSYHDQAFKDRSRYSQESELYCTQTGKKFKGKNQAKSNKSNAKQEQLQQKVDQEDENDSFGADIGQE